MVRACFLGFIEIHFFSYARRELISGAAMIAELKRHGNDISPGTLSPFLHALEEESGSIRHSSQVIEEKAHKEYGATEEGKYAFQELLLKLRKLVSEVLKQQELPSLLASEDTLWEVQKRQEE
jgi:DNA-binding PadR family transcriptional regulator